MLKVILTFYDHMTEALRQAVSLERALPITMLDQIARMREWPPEVAPGCAHELLADLETTFCEME